MTTKTTTIMDPLLSAEVLDSACLPQTLPECHALISAQELKLSELQAQVQLLQERINLDSNNSSKPPSGNGPGQKNKSNRRSSGKPKGAQPGHPGSTRKLLSVDEVNSITECQPPEICECGQAIQVMGAALRHQVFDVPPIKPVVDEYRLLTGRCQGCTKMHSGVLPEGVPRGQLGPNVLGLIGTLGTRYHLTLRKTQSLLDQLLGITFSVGAISQAQGKVSEALKLPVAQALASLRHAKVLNMDETRYPRFGQSSSWMWTAVQPLLAVFCIYPSRARYVMHDMIGDASKAVVGSDRYAVYTDLESRQVCWAHLLRDFTRIGQRPGLAGYIGRKLHGLGLVMFRRRSQQRLSGQGLEDLKRHVHKALHAGADQTQCHRTAKTCANVLAVWNSLWTFTTNTAVQPTNNAAEQALRSVVIKRKISGANHSQRGDRFIGRGFTVHETCLRQGRNLWEFMSHSVTAWLGKGTYPSLIPIPPAASPA